VLGVLALGEGAVVVEAGEAGAAVGAAAAALPGLSDVTGAFDLSELLSVDFSAESPPASGFILSE